MTIRLIVGAGIMLVAVLLWRSVFMVDETEVAMLTRFGALQTTLYTPGAHLKSPLDEVHRFDRRLLTHSYPNESFLSQDQKPLSVDFSLRWRVADPARLFAADGGDEDAIAAHLADLVRDQIRASLASASLVADIGDTHLAGTVLRADALRTGAEQLGVELVDVQLQRIDLPEEELNAVYQRMQQSLISQAQQLHSQGSADADRIRADADRKRADILADSTRASQRVRGEADAAASATYAHAYGANPEFAAFTRSLQAYRTSLGREGDILVISPEGEFFKYLHSASGR